MTTSGARSGRIRTRRPTTRDRPPPQLVALAAHPRVIGIGETGLDFHYDHSPRDVQERVFRAHIAASAAQRAAADHPCPRGRRRDRAHPAARSGRRPACCIASAAAGGWPKRPSSSAFTSRSPGIVTFRNAEELRAIVRDVPLDRLLVETDAPYLAPVPYRGKRNEPAYVAATAAAVAELKGIEPEELAAATTDNFFRLFQKARRPAAVSRA